VGQYYEEGGSLHGFLFIPNGNNNNNNNNNNSYLDHGGYFCRYRVGDGVQDE
jgi:hypothetical protein